MKSLRHTLHFTKTTEKRNRASLNILTRLVKCYSSNFNILNKSASYELYIRIHIFVNRIFRHLWDRMRIFIFTDSQVKSYNPIQKKSKSYPPLLSPFPSNMIYHLCKCMTHFETNIFMFVLHTKKEQRIRKKSKKIMLMLYINK